MLEGTATTQKPSMARRAWCHCSPLKATKFQKDHGRCSKLLALKVRLATRREATAACTSHRKYRAVNQLLYVQYAILHLFCT